MVTNALSCGVPVFMGAYIHECLFSMGAYILSQFYGTVGGHLSERIRTGGYSDN